MRVCNTCGRLSPRKKYLSTDIYLFGFKVCLKDVTDVEFLCSLPRLFQSLIVEGRKVCTCINCRYTICISKIIYRDVSLTVGAKHFTAKIDFILRNTKYSILKMVALLI